ncbi:hypothetical protein ACLHDG_08105 [Sulfurovum sp. CS9]|uniref:hypothetical protein n=1 Tax=Sulfurovum sp. CS9 TaxID=3391146 RepID=UPI0039EA83AD
MSSFTDQELNWLNGIGATRHGFIFPFSLNALLDAMSEKEEGITLAAIRKFVRTGEVAELFQYALAPIALNQFIEVYMKDARAFVEKVRINKINGAKGGSAPRNPIPPPK